MKYFVGAIELAASLKASSPFMYVLWGWGSEE